MVFPQQDFDAVILNYVCLVVREVSFHTSEHFGYFASEPLLATFNHRSKSTVSVGVVLTKGVTIVRPKLFLRLDNLLLLLIQLKCVFYWEGHVLITFGYLRKHFVEHQS